MRRAAWALAVIGMATAVGTGAYWLIASRDGESRLAGLHTRPVESFVAQASVGVLTPGGWVERAATLEGSDGSVRTVFADTGEQLLDDGAQVVRVRRGRAAEWFGGSQLFPTPEKLAEAYSSTTGPGQPIAGRPTVRTTLIRRATGRPALVVDADVETGLVLRRESYRQDGRLAARTEIREVQYGVHVTPVSVHAEPPESDDQSAPDMTLDEFHAVADFEPVAPTYVPAGYRSEGFHGHRCPRGRLYGEFRYHDGIRPLSVFERRPGGESQRAGDEGAGPGRGRGRGWGGPPAGRGRAGVGRPQVSDLGIALSVRQRRGDIVVDVTGDVTTEEAVHVLESIPAQ